jgi:hypothetical protein
MFHGIAFGFCLTQTLPNMFYEDYTTGGTYIAAGDTYHDVALAIKDALVNASGSPWAEVTSSSPTPVWLQPYATTAVAARNSSTASYNGWDNHATLYHTGDLGHRTKTVTVAGSAGTLSITIDGVPYTEAYSTSAAVTATNWLATHTATLAALGSPVVASAGASAEIVLYKAAAEPVLSDTSSGGMSFTWSANCAMFRIVIGYHGLVPLGIDTHQADPSLAVDWCVFTRILSTWNPDNSSSSYYGADDTPCFLFKFDSSETTCPTDNTFRFYVWMWDETFSIVCASATLSPSYSNSGGVHVWTPVVDGISGLARADFPHMWGIPGKYSYANGILKAWLDCTPRLCKFSDQAREADWRGDISGIETTSLNSSPELGFMTSGPSVNGTAFVQRLSFHSSIQPDENTAYSFYSGPWTEGMRVIDRATAYTTGDNGGCFRKITIGGVDYIQIKDTTGTYTLHDMVYVLPLSDLTL